MISSIMTPLAWYEDIFESDRFSSDCDILRYELISDKTRILPFQFRRPKSPALVTRWMLRKECEDPTVPLIENNDSLFTYDTGYWSKINFAFDNGKIKNSGGLVTGSLTKAGVFADDEGYIVKIVVSELKSPGPIDITVSTNTQTILSITGAGTFSSTFKATVSDLDFSLVYSLDSPADVLVIESVQIYKYQKFNTGIGDINLPLSQLYLGNINSEEDIIQYCGDVLPFQIPACNYYMIITTDDNKIYYSELITFKDFVPSQSPFTMLEWNNSCDLSDVIYQEVGGCSYKNRLYIEGELSKPEYPFKEDAEEDGNYKLNILFQKWQKKTSLVVAKCPEFIVDSLTAMRLHDTVNVTKSIRKKQIQTLSPFEVEKVEFENSSVFNDCATNVELKILLKDKVVDSTCCENIPLAACKECDYTVEDIDMFSFGYFFGELLDEDFDLYAITSIDISTINGVGSGMVMAGDYFTIPGDKSLIYSVGSTVKLSGPLTSVNSSPVIVTAVVYDAGLSSTAIQWAGITPYYGDIMGSLEKFTYEAVPDTDGKTVCADGKRYYKFDDAWQQVPSFEVVDTDLGGGAHSYLLTGFGYPGSYITISVVIYDAVGDLLSTMTISGVFTAEELIAGITVLSSEFTEPVPEDEGTVTFTIHSYELNCDYGNHSEVVEYITELHPIVQTWYDALEGDKLSTGKLYPLNDFIQGLDDDGAIGEFDMLHVLAGMETDEQRMKPLITTSGNDFVPLNGPTLDSGGVTGDGAFSYLNLAWKALSDGVKHLQDDCSFGLFSNTNGDSLCDMGYIDAGADSVLYCGNAGTATGKINSGVSASGSVATTVGLFSMFGGADTVQRLFQGNAELGNYTGATGTMHDVDFYLCARNNSTTPEDFSDRQIQLVYIGSSSVSRVALGTRFSTLKTANAF